MASEPREPYVLDFPNGQSVDAILKKAQSLVNILAIGDGLTLDSNGVLTASGGFLPTADQLDAMNSGITADKVAEIAEISEIVEAVTALAEAVVTKQSLTCDTEVTLIDMDFVANIGSYYIPSESVQGLRNLPAGVSGNLRVDVIELPVNLRQQRVLTSGSTPQIYIRNSTSEPEPSLLPIIPAMSGYTSSRGEVIESGHYQSRFGWLAFDGVDSHTWQHNSWSDGTNVLDGTADKCYVGYVWSAAQVVSAVKISFSSDTNYTGCVQCRVDGVWQTVLPSITISGASPYYSVVEQELDEPVECDAIRFSILTGSRERFCASTYGGNVCEFIVYGDIPGGVVATWGSWVSVSTS